MNKYIVLLAAGLTIFPANTAYAEDAVEEPIVIEETAPESEPEPAPGPEPAPEPGPAYVPPAEAGEGLGGWAVVDPETGAVYGASPCTIDICGPEGSLGGKVSEGYMGCSGCVYRFQSVEDEQGNVSGVFSHDSREVKWNEEENNFSIKDGMGVTSTLIPEKTDGRGLLSGVEDIVSKTKTTEEVLITEKRQNVYEEDVVTDILFPEWGHEGTLFSYMSRLQAENGLAEDVDKKLLNEGYFVEKTETFVNVEDETGKQDITNTKETVVDEESSFVKSVRAWTKSVFDFFKEIVSYENI